MYAKLLQVGPKQDTAGAQQENTIYEVQLQADIAALAALPKQHVHCRRPFSVLALDNAYQVSARLQPASLRADSSGMSIPFKAISDVNCDICLY